MRATLFLSALALTTVAAAQTVVLDTTQEAITEAYNNLRNDDGFRFEMKGTETNGAAKANLYAVLFWKRAVDPRTGLDSSIRVELDVYDMTRKGTPITLRIVGDGLNLYRYDLDRREVSTSRYGLYDSEVGGVSRSYTDGPRLLAQLRAATPGLAAYLVRLAAEVNPSGGGSASRYAAWAPGRQGLGFDAVPVPIRHINPTLDEASYVVDPLSGRPSVKGVPDAQQYAFFGYDGRATDRTVAFTLYDANYDPKHESSLPPRWLVQSVGLALSSPNRFVDVTLTPNLTTDFPAGTFAPYSGTYFRPVNGSNH